MPRRRGTPGTARSGSSTSTSSGGGRPRRPCARAHADGETAAELRAEQDDCLDATLGAFEAGVDVLMEIEDRHNRALELVAGLPRPMDCESAPAAADRVRLPEDPAARRAVKECRGEIARAESLMRVARFDAAGEIATRCAARAEELEYLPLTLETQLLAAEVASGAGRPNEASDKLEATYAAATEAGEDRVAARAAFSLAWSFATLTEQREEAEAWCRHAHAAIDRLEGGAPVLRANVHRVDARNLVARDRFDEALKVLDAAVAGLDRVTGRGHPVAAMLTEHRALILRDMARFDEAREAYNAARSWKVEYFGADHPYVATSDRMLGWLAVDEKDYTTALRHFERAHAGYLRAYGPDHRKMAESYASVGVARMQLGQVEEALPDLHRGVELLEAHVGENSAAIAEKHNYLGVAYKKLERYDEALTHYHRALQLYESERGSGSSAVARLSNNISNLYRVQRKYDRALPYAERAHEILTKTRGATHPDTLDAVESLGYIAQELGNHEQALRRFTVLAKAPDRRAEGAAGRVRALRKLDRGDEATAVLEEAERDLADRPEALADLEKLTQAE